MKIKPEDLTWPDFIRAVLFWLLMAVGAIIFITKEVLGQEIPPHLAYRIITEEAYETAWVKRQDDGKKSFWISLYYYHPDLFVVIRVDQGKYNYGIGWESGILEIRQMVEGKWFVVWTKSSLSPKNEGKK